MRQLWWAVILLLFIPKVTIAARITQYTPLTTPTDAAYTYFYDSGQPLGFRDRTVSISAMKSLFSVSGYVPLTRTVNGRSLNNDISLTPSDIGAVSPSIKVNEYPLSADVTLGKGDIGLGNVDNLQQMPLSYLDLDSNMTANSDTRVPSQAAVKTYVDGKTPVLSWGSITGTLSFQTDLNTALSSKVPTSRTVAGHELTGNVTVSATDVGLGNVSNVAQMPLTYLDTDANMAANSNTKVPSQAAVVSYVAAHSGEGGGGVWGSIIGTLSNQTDLQAVLDTKMPLTNLPSTTTSGQISLFSGTTGKVLTPATGTGFTYSTSGVFSTTTNGSTLTTLNASNLSSGVVAAARGGAGTINGILKANGSGVVSAVSSTDVNTLYGYTPMANTAFSGFSKITVGTVAPSAPSANDIWVDTTGL